MSTLAKRKNTRMVINPNRGGVLIGGRRASSKTTARRNPVKRAATSAISNPRKRRSTRRRRNPVSRSIFTNPSGSALMAAALAGVGFSVVDYGLSRLVPSGSPVIQIGSKLAAGFLIQTWGNKVPILGKYKDGVAFLCFALAAAQAANIYLLPTARNLFGQVTGGLQTALLPAPTTVVVNDPMTMAGISRRARYGVTN